MYTPKAALQMFNREHRDLTVTAMGNYKTSHYVLTAVKDPNKTDYSDPYYLVNKETGRATQFIPQLDDIDELQNAFYEHAIDLKTLK